MNELLIVGAGVHAAETADIVRRINRLLPTWDLLGYLAPDSQLSMVGKELGGLPVLGGWSRLGDYPGAMLATPFDSLEVKDIPRERLVSIIDPSAWVASTARIGPGCVIYPHCFVGHGAVLEERVFVLASSVINHDDYLGPRVTLCSGVSLAGSAYVEADCYLGQSCTVKQLIRIGRDSLIGMGSVVLRDVPPNSVMAGNPARRLRDRYDIA